MTRLIKADMDSLLFNLNLSAGTPLGKLEYDGATLCAAVGHYWIQSAGGRHRLVQTINKNGEFAVILTNTFVQYRTCYELVKAFKAGIEAARKSF